MKLHWTADTWISLSAVVISLMLGVPALMQARSAKRQQVLMQQDYDDRRAESDEASGPTFSVHEAHLVQDGEYFAKIKIAMTGGNPAQTIKITARGKDVRSLASFTGDIERLEEKVWTDASPGAVIEVIAHLEWNHDTPVNVTLDLVCEEAGGQHRRWLRSVTAAAVEPPGSDDREAWKSGF